MLKIEAMLKIDNIVSFNNNITIISQGSDTIISTENSNTVILASDGGALIIFNTSTGNWLQM